MFFYMLFDVLIHIALLEVDNKDPKRIYKLVYSLSLEREIG